MSYALSPPPKFQAWTIEGIPLSGGLLYTYEAGTSTPADTFSDDSGTANSNPVILDTAGRATVYLDTSATYKFVLQDSLGAIQYSQDNISVGSAGGGGGDTPGTGFGLFLDLGSGTSFTCDWNQATWFRISPSGNFSIAFSNTPAAGREKSIVIEVVDAQGLTATIPGGGTWGALGEPEWSSTVDLVTVGMRNAESTSLWMLAHPGEV